MEIVRYSGTIFTLLALPNLIKRNANIKIDLFESRIDKNILLTIIFNLFLLFCLALLFVKGIEIFKFGMKQLTPALQIPIGYLYIFTPLAGILSIVQLINYWITKFINNKEIMSNEKVNFDDVFDI